MAVTGSFLPGSKLLRDRFENADCDMPIFASPFWANMIHALDVDKPEPWPDGQDRQKD
jgi:hypothetical protein